MCLIREEKKNNRSFADTGVRIFNVPAYFGDQGINSISCIRPFRPSVWIDSAQYDLTPLKEVIDEINSIAADTMITIRVHLDPPRWWQERNPDELCLLTGIFGIIERIQLNLKLSGVIYPFNR